MQKDKKIIIKARAVILHEGKILVVKHSEDSDFYALPGGKLEFGESPLECLKREMIEEMGVEPKVGRLLYVNTFIQKDADQTVEFLFEVTNVKDYLNTEKIDGTHRYELFEILWADKNENIKILPERIQIDFKNDSILSDVVKFIN